MPRVSNAARYRKVELLGRWTCADSTDKVTPSGRAASASMTSQTRSTARSGYRAPPRDLSDVIAGSPPAVSVAVDARLYSDGVVVPTSPVWSWPPARACIAFLGRTMGLSPIRFDNIVYSLSLLQWRSDKSPDQLRCQPVSDHSWSRIRRLGDRASIGCRVSG